MANSKSTNLKTKTARNKLESYRDPHWLQLPPALCKGASLGFRRSPETQAETWHGRLYLEGKYQQTNLGEVTPHFQYEDAYAAALKWARELRDSGPAPVRVYTVEDVLEEYLMKLQANGDRRNMDRRRNASKRLDALVPASIKRMKVNELEKTDLDRMQRDYSQRLNLQGKLISPESVNRAFTPLLAALNHGYKNKWISDNSAWRHYERLPEETDKRRAKQYLSTDQREAFLKACPEPLKTFCAAMNLTAARPSELRRLKVSEVDLNEGQVRLLTYKGKKGGSMRYFPLPEGSVVRDLFTAQVAEKAADQFVFTSETGKPWGQANLAKAHNNVRDKGKFSDGFETYVWRHCRITDWVKHFPAPEVATIAGTSLQFIQKNYYKTDSDIRSKMAGL